MSDYKPYFKRERVSPDHCKAGVWSGFRSYQCARKPTRDGYCGSHHPDAVKKRDEKRDAAFAAKRDGWRRESDIADAEREVVEAALALKIYTDAPEARALRAATEKLRALKVSP